jgi:ribosomal protein S18 acetylase RimI-like enzyme
MSIDVRRPGPEDVDELLGFFGRVPAGERVFFKEEILDRSSVERWLAPGAPGRRALAVDGAEVAGYLAVVPLPGWSDHVGEIRMVIDPERRRQGLGRMLARRAVLDAIQCRLSKLVVEVVAEQDRAVAMFEALGFRAEGLLRDHVRDRDGRVHDLIVLGHVVDEQWEAMATAGIEDALTG